MSRSPNGKGPADPIVRIVSEGYADALRGVRESESPYPVGSVGRDAWTFGHRFGALPRGWRWALRAWCFAHRSATAVASVAKEALRVA